MMEKVKYQDKGGDSRAFSKGVDDVIGDIAPVKPVSYFGEGSNPALVRFNKSRQDIKIAH
jgi:hypothetical protein